MPEKKPRRAAPTTLPLMHARAAGLRNYGDSAPYTVHSAAALHWRMRKGVFLVGDVQRHDAMGACLRRPLVARGQQMFTLRYLAGSIGCCLQLLR